MMHFSKTLLGVLMAVLGSAILLASAPLPAVAAPQPSAVAATPAASVVTLNLAQRAQLTPKLRDQIAKDVALAKKLTTSRNGELQFKSAKALRLGMSRAFMKAYTSALRTSNAHPLPGEVTVFSPKKGATLDCLISMLGIGAATAALIMAVVASAGVAAVAVLGFGISGITVVRSCY